MTIENDDQALRKELDDLVGSMDQWSTPLNPSDVPNAPPAAPSPTFESLSQDGTIDGLTLSSRLDRETELLNQQARDTINTPGVFGQSWGIQTPEETQATLAERQSEISRKRTSIEAPPSALGEFFGAINRNLPTLPTLPFSGRMTADQIREQIRKDLDKEQEQLNAVSDDPTYRARSGVRSAAENTAQGLGNLAGGVVEGIGIGAGYAGNALGLDVTSSDNTIAAVGRWTQARAKAAFPGDVARQEDFSSKLAQGVGSLAGFYGVSAASVAAKLSSPMRTALVAMVGSMSTGAQTYGEARNSISQGRDVSDRQLLMTYLGGLVLGAAEAAPITMNIPGLSPQTKSKALAYLATAGREGFEESLQEGFQAFAQNAIAMGHDPARTLLDGVGENALIGFLTGGGAQALQLAASKSARQNSLDEASRGGSSPVQGATRPAADAPQQATPTAPATAAPPPTATPGKPFTVDLSEVYGDQPPVDLAASARPAYDPANEMAGSGRPVSPTMADAAPVPSFADMRKFLPADENGDPDLAAFYAVSEKETGKRYWNQLNDIEKITVVRSLEAATAAVEAGTAPQAGLPQAPAIAQSSLSAQGSSDSAIPGPAGNMAQPLKEAATGKPTAQAATPPTAKASPQVQQAQAEAAQAIEIYRKVGIPDDMIERAAAVPPPALNPELSQALEGIDVDLDLDVMQDDGSTETETLMLPAIQALQTVDRRLQGVTLLLKCLG